MLSPRTLSSGTRKEKQKPWTLIMVDLYGTEKQKKKYLTPLTRGESIMRASGSNMTGGIVESGLLLHDNPHHI